MSLHVCSSRPFPHCGTAAPWLGCWTQGQVVARTHHDSRDHNHIGFTCAYLWWSFVKDCEQKWATRIRAATGFFFFFFWLIDARCRMIDAWLLLSRVAAELLWAAPVKRQRYGFIRAESGERGHRSQRWQANIMSASADNDVIDMGVIGWRGINICKVPWKLMDESGHLTWWGSWLTQINFIPEIISDLM